MSIRAFVLRIIGLLISISLFVFGRITAESMAVLAAKRRVFEEFLRHGLWPNDAYVNEEDGRSKVEGELNELWVDCSFLPHLAC